MINIIQHRLKEMIYNTENLNLTIKLLIFKNILKK